MLNRSQIYTLLRLRQRDVYDSADVEITDLLHHIAYGNLYAAKAMLYKNPRLVLQSAHTETPSGLKVLHTTPLECALGAGDPEMAEMIEQYFYQFDGGATVRDEQLARYRQHIADMLNPEKNPPYDFTLLIKTLMAASPEEVTAATNLDMNYPSVLRDVLAQFRKDFTPGTITRGMHFNYLHLLRALEVYNHHFDASYQSSGDNHDKSRLFCRQVIGFIQRSLPAIDRMVFAQDLYHVAKNKEKIERKFKFNVYFTTDFPVTAGDSSSSGLGYEYWYGFADRAQGSLCSHLPFWKTYVEQKLQACRTYVDAVRREEKTGCCAML